MWYVSGIEKYKKMEQRLSCFRQSRGTSGADYRERRVVTLFQSFSNGWECGRTQFPSNTHALRELGDLKYSKQYAGVIRLDGNQKITERTEIPMLMERRDSALMR